VGAKLFHADRQTYGRWTDEQRHGEASSHFLCHNHTRPVLVMNRDPLDDNWVINRLNYCVAIINYSAVCFFITAILISDVMCSRFLQQFLLYAFLLTRFDFGKRGDDTIPYCSKYGIWSTVKKLPAFYAKRKFIIAFTTARHLFLFWDTSIQSRPPFPHPTSLTSMLVLTSHQRLGISIGVVPSGFPTKSPYALLLSTIRATCPAHLSLLAFITRMIFGEERYRATQIKCIYKWFSCQTPPADVTACFSALLTSIVFTFICHQMSLHVLQLSYNVGIVTGQLTARNRHSYCGFY
jgi:hypothetical protein